MKTIEKPFVSRGTNCAGTLLLPEAKPAAMIVMAHGFGAIRAAGLYPFAEKFLRAGYAVFLFDYRTFGDSEGSPRHWASPRRHLQDWDAAVHHVRALPEVAGVPLVVWGSSFGGGHVLQTAALNRMVDAVIAQVPHTSGFASTAEVLPHVAVRLVLAGLRDLVGGWFGFPHYLPIVGRPGDVAALSTAECWDGYLRLFAKNANWANTVRARVFLELPWYSPLRHAHKIKVPALIVVGADDSVTPAAAARRTANRIRDCEFHTLPCNHFAPYYDAEFEANVALQLAFLKRRMPAPAGT
ncbi:alpha/beta hydrolase [Niveispirillum sp. KHB5.9]|uniref:alpha/beta hydrolase n=1 Tax=Niveispirillum sp. KHB5.9 TaxID=3400269 RepID=UPI003A877C84